MKDRIRADDGDGEYGADSRRPGQRRFLSYADLEQRYGKSRVTIWRWIRAGIFPAPYEIADLVGLSWAKIMPEQAA